MKKKYNSIGTMSGTSMDGIDVSLLYSDGEKEIKPKDNFYLAFQGSFKKELYTYKTQIKSTLDCKEFINTSTYQKLSERITDFHAETIQKLIQKNDKVDLIGFHGLTLWHCPKDLYTHQMGNPKKLFDHFQIPIVFNFRKNDIANGGQGAPLTPIFHKAILEQFDFKFDSFVNIGGISNITYLKNNKIHATDIGPGNCLLDKWVKENFNEEFDIDGKYSSITNPDLSLANSFLDKYENNKIISYDINDFDLSSFRGLNKNVGASTLAYITAKLILNFCQEKNIKKFLISGGGRKNKTIMQYLGSLAETTDQYNIDGDFVESQAFAYLAIRCLEKKFISFPETTGASTNLTGGEVLS